MWYTKENYQIIRKWPSLVGWFGKSQNAKNRYFSHVNIICVFIIYKGCNASKGQEMDSNQSGAVGETIWDPFQGSLTHLGASGRLQSQIQAIPGQILTFPDPPCQLGQLKWSEMACTGVPQIVLHILCSTRTYWGHFRPCKVSFSALAERSSLLLRQCEFWKYCF